MSDYRYQHLLRQDCPLPPGTHVVAYCRDSGGEEQDRSVQQQVEAIREYCERFGLMLEHVYLDEATAATAIEKRDQFGAMMDDLRTRFPSIYDPGKRERKSREKPFGIICWKSNRLGRDLIHTRHVKSDLRLRGITIVSLISTFSSGNPAMDALIESFVEYQDEQLLREISENARRGLAQLVTLRDTDPEFLAHNHGWQPTGAYLGIMPGGVPTGFKGERIIIGTYKRKNGKRSGELRSVQRIVPDPETWERCRLAWEMRRQGATLREIMSATRLFKTAGGYQTFFANLIYTGTLDYGGQRLVNFVPALIPMAWWEEEAAKRSERGRIVRGETPSALFNPRRVGGKHLLSGLLFCGAIEGEEHPMLADAIPAKKGKRGHWDFYICDLKKNSRNARCPSKRLGAKVIETAVVDALMTHVLTLENLRPLADMMAQEMNTSSRQSAVRFPAAQSELRQVERQIANLLAAIEEIGFSASVKEQLVRRESERAHLVHEIERLERMLSVVEITQITDAMLNQWLAHMRASLSDPSSEAARQAVRHFVHKVVVRDGDGDIYYTFALSNTPDDSRHLGQRTVDLRGFEPLTSTVRL